GHTSIAREVCGVAAGEPEVRWFLLLATGREHPRGQGLHLRCTLRVRVHRRCGDGAGGRRHRQRRHRRGTVGDALRTRQAGPRPADRGRGGVRAPVRHRCAADRLGLASRAGQPADRTGLGGPRPGLAAGSAGAAGRRDHRTGRGGGARVLRADQVHGRRRRGRRPARAAARGARRRADRGSAAVRPFELGAVPALSRSTVDRQETLRTDPDRLVRRWADARVVVVDPWGRTPVRREAVGAVGAASGAESGGAPVSTRKAADLAAVPPEDASFLGEWDGVDYWMLPVDAPSELDTVEVDGGWGVRQEMPASDDEVWLELRGHGALLDDTSAGLLTTAEALRNWHWRGRFCARCGAPVRRTQFGWATHCTGCEREEYPRTDPAVICLVHDDVGVNGAKVLLARQPVWPPKRYSVLAGFVEAGESLEGCVE